jgi:hypothetical protein
VTLLTAGPATPAAESPERALELLSGMAVALGHDVDVDVLLADVATGVRRTLDADRVSVLLLDEADRLSPAVSVARQHDDDLWQRFRRMPPIALDDLPGARQALGAGTVLVIDDASASPLVPHAWQRTFALDALAIAPLLVDDVAAGLVAVEYAQPADPYTPSQLALLEGMAALAVIALRGGRQRSQAQRVADTSTLLRALTGLRTARAVAEHALPALLATARASHGLFALLDADAVEVVAVRGPELPEPGRYPLTELPTGLVAACHEAWATDPRRLVAGDVRGSALAVLPIAGPHAPVALVVLPLVLASVPYDVVAELQLLADATATALHTVRVRADRDWHRRALSLLVPEPRAGVAAVVTEAQSLLVDAGIDAPRVVADRAVARATGLPPARADVARLLARWRRSAGASGPRQIGTELAAPLRADGRVIGAVLWRPSRPAPVGARAEQVMTVLGDLLGRAAARRRVDELEQTAADAAAHAAVATRAYREAGQLLGLLSNHLHTGAGSGSRPVAAEALVGQARRLLRDATEVLAPATARQADLRPALTAMARQIGAHGGPETVVRQTGRAPVLDPAVQVSVVRATQRVLALLREIRAVAAAVHIETGERDVVVTVRADELVAAAQDGGAGLLATLRDARGWLSPVGGSIEIVRDAPPHRFVVRAPTGASRPERPSPAIRQESREVVVSPA